MADVSVDAGVVVVGVGSLLVVCWPPRAPTLRGWPATASTRRIGAGARGRALWGDAGRGSMARHDSIVILDRQLHDTRGANEKAAREMRIVSRLIRHSRPPLQR